MASTFGTLGAVCWCVQLLPQIWLNYRRHSAASLSPAFMLFWAGAGVPLGVYNIVASLPLALKIQPQILTCLSLVTWTQCHYYRRQWSVGRAVALGAPVACLLGGIEVGLVWAVRAGMGRGIEAPLILMAVLAAVFLALGVLEQYVAIIRHRSAEGVSFLFCGLDALGDLTSIVAVIYGSRLNVTGLVAYAVELALWMGVFTLGSWYRLRPWVKEWAEKRLGRRAQLAEHTPQHHHHHHHHLHQRQQQHDAELSGAVTIHHLPSASSVFQTPESAHELRPRHHPVAPSQLSGQLPSGGCETSV